MDHETRSDLCAAVVDAASRRERAGRLREALVAVQPTRAEVEEMA